MNIRRQTAGSIFWIVFQNASHRMVTLAVFLVLARLLTPEDFGLVALAGSAVAFIELFVQVGFAEAIVQRKDLEDGHLDTAFWVMLGIALLLTASAILLAEPISLLFDSPELVPVLRCLSFGIILVTLSRVQAAILRRQFKFKSLAVRTTIASICGGVVGVTLAFGGFGVWALVAQQLVDSVVGLIVLWTSSKWRPGFVVSRSHCRDLFNFGMYMMGAQFMYFVNQHSARLIVGYSLGAVSLGLYSVANRLIAIVHQMLQRTFETVLFSTFSRMQSDMDRLRAGFLASSRLVIMAVFPVLMFLTVTGPETVVVLFGEKWSSSGTLLQFLAFAGLLSSATAFHGAVFKAAGKPNLSLRLSVVTAVLTFTSTLFAVNYGIEAVVIARIVCAVIVVPYSFFLVNQIIPLGSRLMAEQFRGPVIGLAGLTVSIILARNVTPAWPGGFSGLLTMALVGFTCYGAILWLVDKKLVIDAWGSARLILARGGKAPG